VKNFCFSRKCKKIYPSDPDKQNVIIQASSKEEAWEKMKEALSQEIFLFKSVIEDWSLELTAKEEEFIFYWTWCP